MCFRPPPAGVTLALSFLRVRSAYLRPVCDPPRAVLRPCGADFLGNFMHNILPHRRPLGENAETMFQVVAAIVCFCLIGVLLAL